MALDAMAESLEEMTEAQAFSLQRKAAAQEQPLMQHLGFRCSLPPSCCSELALRIRSTVQNPKTTLSDMKCGVPCKMLLVKSCMEQATSKCIECKEQHRLS